MTELLVDIPENPVPDGSHAAKFVARDGKAIRYGLFAAPRGSNKGTVVVLTGRNECVEKYFETVRDLQKRGFGAAVLDWRGQGGSDRMIRDPARGYVRSFGDYVGDLEQFFKEVVLPDCPAPYYVLGHSTGSLVALLAAPNLLNRVRRMVLIAPMFEIIDQPFSTAAVRRISAFLYYLGFGSFYVTGGPRPKGGYPFADNKLTTDLGRFKRNAALFDKAPNLAMGGPTVAWVHAASEAIGIVTDPDFMARIRIPILFVAAGADEVVSTPSIEDYARRLRAGSMVTIDGARHEILQEADIYREQFLAAFDAFIPGEDFES